MLLEILPLIVMFLFYGGLFALLIYFVVKRIEDKSKEDFEKRDN
jgi:hypothetical protein